MEDYTYHFSPAGDLILGAHMLEVCPSIAGATARASRSTRSRSAARPTRCGSSSTPTPGRRSPPASWTWASASGWSRPSWTSCPPSSPCRSCRSPAPSWRPRPDLRTAAAAWIYAGGSHHTSFSYAVTAEHLRDFAAMSGIEFLVIDETTTLDGFRDQLRWNDLYYLLARGL